MKNIFRYVTICLVAIIFIFFTSCKEKSSKLEINIAKKKTISVTIYPLKSIISEIVGDKINIEVILPIGASPHTFEPKPSDLEKINKSELLFYVSQNLDAWATKLLTNSKSSDSSSTKLISTLEMLDKNLLIYSSVHCEHSHAVNSNSNIVSNFHISTCKNVDPHFWLAPTTVKNILPKLLEKISKLDSSNSQYYKNQAERFSKQLDSITYYIKNNILINKHKYNKFKIFTFHNSFGYFINEFGLDYGGSIQEYSNKESGTKYASEITKKIKESSVKAIFSEPQLNPKSAEIISTELGLKVFKLDPLGGNEKNKTYKQLIINNAETISSALEI